MLILHTADWHLGRQFEGHSLSADFEHVLEQVFAILVDRAADVLIIAGDIFDRSSPPETAVRLFNCFINRVSSETKAKVVLIAGNHDSADRIAAMAMFADGRKALVRGSVSARNAPLLLESGGRSLAISALPFAMEFTAREVFADLTIATPEDVLKAQIAAARAEVPEHALWIVVAHAFVSGGSVSDVERRLTRSVGGVETVSADAFGGAAYVALGHLHRAQSVSAPHIRYAGSLLPFSFDEEGNDKSVTLIDVNDDGTIGIDAVPITPRRKVRTLRGAFDWVLSLEPSDDFVRIVLTDSERRIDPMKRIRERFPFACALTYARDEPPSAVDMKGRAAVAARDPVDVVVQFVTSIRGEDLSDAERHLVEAELAALATVRIDEAAA